MSTFQPVRGMRDLLPDETEIFRYLITQATKNAQLYGFKEVITPVVEPYELLSAKSGEEIRQRMFTFKDLGDRTVALRPEFTASIARLVTTTLKNEPKPLRLFSVGSVYRYDEPQKGRYREFWQANFELIGSAKPEADAEIILLTNSMMKKTGLTNYAIKLGHVGTLKGILTQEGVDDKTQNAVLQRMDKKDYNAALALVSSEKCRNKLQELIELKSNNPFDTVEQMKAHVKDYEKATAAVENLATILKIVTDCGCEIKTVDPAFARGLEYYTGMIFEVYIPQLDIALGGGGRYDKLIEVFGGEPTPAVGVAYGLDRMALAIQTQKITLHKEEIKRVAVLTIKDEQKSEALKIAQMLREAGIAVEFEVMGRKTAKALEFADKHQVDYAVIVGERELKVGKVVLKDFKQRQQTEVALTELATKIKA
ncbi:MAG: histidine--tRNA ligase [Candidatus Bathyarchaeota archaeon]|nr:histidine--tRNA ligase [Candidatus Bathyarchaeota archaeon]